MLEKVATNCRTHSYNEMAKVLGVQSKTLNKQVWRTKLVFTNLEENDPKKCFFCQNTEFPQNTDSPLEKKRLLTT